MNEINFNRLRTKQKSIGKLFPEFGQRVKTVASKGGVEMREMMPDFWHFTVTSGTKEGVKYDVYVEFTNIPEMIKKYAGDQSLWKKDKSGPKYTLLAAEILNSVDMKFSCSCPADLYWGGAYIKTQRDAQFGRQENRPPNIRNPRQYGAYCKHTELMASVLPNYTSTFASFLKKYWSDDVDNAVEAFTAQKAAFGAVGDELKKMAYDTAKSTRGPYGRDEPLEEPGEDIDVDEEPPTPDDDEPPENIGPSSATKSATKLPVRGTKPGITNLQIEPEDNPKVKDKGRKGHYTPNESVNEDSFKERLGNCYSLSGKYVMNNLEWDLIHGTITEQVEGGRTIGHAWVENTETHHGHDIKMIYDPVWDKKLPWDAYERFVGAKEEQRYTRAEMVKIILEQQNWGPWDE